MTRRPGSTTAWRKMRLHVLNRDRWTCHHCHTPIHPRCQPGGCDHCAHCGHWPTAKADGGPDTPDNLVALCQACNVRGRTPRPPVAAIAPPQW